jgi:hypothetical protein
MMKAVQGFWISCLFFLGVNTESLRNAHQPAIPNARQKVIISLYDYIPSPLIPTIKYEQKSIGFDYLRAHYFV